MKAISIFIAILFTSNLLLAQRMVIYKSNGTIEAVSLNEIDSIKFEVGTTCPGIPTVTYEGKVYNTVLIGSQCWLKENLDVGIMIQSNFDQTPNGIIEKYCYDDDIDNCTTYGGLYQYDEAMNYLDMEGSQGICPQGWHVPTLAEYQTLATTVGNDGNVLKAIGQGSGGGTGTDTTGFSALLAGQLPTIGSWYGLNDAAYFWSSSWTGGNNAYYMKLFYNTSIISFNSWLRSDGNSVRCIKD